MIARPCLMQSTLRSRNFNSGGALESTAQRHENSGSEIESGEAEKRESGATLCIADKDCP